MFYLNGTLLRLAMVAVAGLWMYHAIHYHSAWQIAANLLSGGAAAYGAWRASRSTGRRRHRVTAASRRLRAFAAHLAHHAAQPSVRRVPVQPRVPHLRDGDVLGRDRQ